MTQTGLHHKMEFNIWEVEEVPAVQGCRHLHSGCEECICHPIVERRMDRTAGGVHNSGTFSAGYRGDKWRGGTLFHSEDWSAVAFIEPVQKITR